MDISAKNNTPTNTKYIQGGYGKVFLVTKSNKVVKQLPLYYEPGCLSFNTVVDAVFSKAVSQFNCTPNVEKVNTDAKFLYIHMPNLGTSLYHLPKWKCRKHAFQILGDVAKVCLDLESIGMQHTDIKHSNILLSKTGEVCLIDFNICSIKHVNPQSIWTPNLGTWEYASPEICLLNHPTNTSTVWSLGILMCYLFGGHPLQVDMDDRDIDTSNQKAWGDYLIHLSTQNPIGLSLPHTLTKTMPVALRRLFHQCTYWDPLQRIDLKAFYKFIRSCPEYVLHPTVELPPHAFLMHPMPSSSRNQDIHDMRDWCKEIKQMHLLCRSIATYDRVSHSAWDQMNAPASLAISYMFAGNYVFLEDPNIAKLAEIFRIRDWALFLHHVLDLCTDLDWDIYELSADVMLLEHVDTEDDIFPMMDAVFEIQKNAKTQYTMKCLTKAFLQMANSDAENARSSSI